MVVEKVSTSNCFKLLGIDENFTIDVNQLDDKYLDLQRDLHPDNLKAHSSKIYQINNAYRILKNPIERAKHLLEINNISVDKEKIPPEYLLQIIELQENLDNKEKEVLSLYDEYFTNMKEAFIRKDFKKALLNFLLLKYVIRLKEKINDFNKH